MLSRIFSFALLLTVTGALTLGQAPPPPYVHLNPGGLSDLPETVPVNIVFVGYPATLVNQAQFLAQLPETYKPVVRSRLFYAVKEELGLRYQYQYNVTFPAAAWQDSFFSTLGVLATPAARTLFQDNYNAQQRNVLDVGANHFIDAPTVEKWLIDHPPAGVDTRRNTIFFVNWWGRSDFKFHVYTKFGEADPDTGYDFGVIRQSRKVIAWGGTPVDDEETGLGPARGERRVWFHDLSAGPESWTGNWNVDNADVDGDGSPDFRLPAIWEYLTPGGARPASALTTDLALVARFVGINLLFTSSPLYPPYLSPLRLPAAINLDVNTYEGWKGVDAKALQTPALLLSEVSKLHRIPYTRDHQDLEFKQSARNCYQLWLNDNPCYATRPYPGFANLFLNAFFSLPETRDGSPGYEAMLFNYATEENRSTGGILGFADDNWIDGTQSGVFTFVSPSIVGLGYGLTSTQIHEYGHHAGMSHPHDGWDSELQIDYGPEGEFYFAWAGDESNSVMSYIDLNWDFSQFDKDNFNRFTGAGYIVNANAIANKVLASGNPAGLAELAAADVEVGIAKTSLAAHDYLGVFDHARLAYLHALAAASLSGVAVPPSDNGWVVLPAVHGKAKGKNVYSNVDRFGPGTKRWID